MKLLRADSGDERMSQIHTKSCPQLPGYGGEKLHALWWFDGKVLLVNRWVERVLEQVMMPEQWERNLECFEEVKSRLAHTLPLVSLLPQVSGYLMIRFAVPTSYAPFLSLPYDLRLSLLCCCQVQVSTQGPWNLLHCFYPTDPLTIFSHFSADPQGSHLCVCVCWNMKILSFKFLLDSSGVVAFWEIHCMEQSEVRVSTLLGAIECWLSPSSCRVQNMFSLFSLSSKDALF